MLRTSKGMSDDQISQMTRHIERLAADEGLKPYFVADNQVGNTSLAHELATWAAEQGKAEEIWSLLFKAYFGEKRSIFDMDSLVALAGEIGLDETEAREALESRRYAEKVRNDATEMQQLGGNGVPFVVVDRKYGIAGAQPLESFIQTIDAAWKERSPLTVVTASEGDGAVCGPEGCD